MKIFRILLVLIIVISFSGCTGTPAKDNSANKSATEGSANNELKKEVLINIYYEKPSSLEDENTILLQGLLEGEEYIEVIVVGEIFAFQQIELFWNEKINELVEKEVFNEIEKIANQTVVIKTYQSEGLPGEKIKWKNKEGKVFEYVIQEDGRGENTEGTRFDLE